MQKRPLLQIILLLALALPLSACSTLFEHNYDVQARKALEDLIEIQEKFYAENGRYAKNLVEIEKYKLTYHTGIVYLEIESAGKDKYRAIALPAESVTARVFAYDTEKGGYYEMDEEEVSRYVLGALNSIRGEQKLKRQVDFMSAGIIVLLVLFGLMAFKKPAQERNMTVISVYFMTLAPMIWSLGLLNHFHKDTHFSTLVIAGLILSIIISLIGITLGFRAILKLFRLEISGLMGTLSFSSILMGIFSIWAAVHTYTSFYPKNY